MPGFWAFEELMPFQNYPLPLILVRQAAFLSAPLEVILRVAEKWFCKLGFFFRLEKSGSANSNFFSGSSKSGWPEKEVGLYYKSIFFQVREKWFYKLGFFFGSRRVVDQKINPSLRNHCTFLEKWLQIKWLTQLPKRPKQKNSCSIMWLIDQLYTELGQQLSLRLSSFW